MAWNTAPKIGALTTVASGDVALAEPAGIAQGDLMVACIAYRDSAAFTLPAGWGLVATQQSSGNATTSTSNAIASGVMAYIVRGASAPALTFARTGGDVGHGRIIAYTPQSGAPTYDTGSANTPAANTATTTTSSITTARANSLLVAMHASSRNTNASAFDATDPSTASGATDTATGPTAGTWLERADDVTATMADTALAIADGVKATAGATGTIQATSPATSRHVLIVGAFYEAAPARAFGLIIG